MADAIPLCARYDADADVLYLNRSREPAARGVEDESGIVWRYRSDGVLVGATLVDFQHLQECMGEAALTIELSQKFGLSQEEASVTLLAAIVGGQHD
jgi:hypothetical protein